MYSQGWIRSYGSLYMCAAFWPDILVIISLGRYLYMLLFHRGGVSEGVRPAWVGDGTPTTTRNYTALCMTHNIYK